jgi:CRP-like cAMP-binding protein
MSQVTDMLQQADFFAGLPPTALDHLALAAHRRHAQASELIFRQGETAATFFLVLSGRLRLVQHTAEGKDVTMATFTPGDLIGLVVAVLGELYPGSAEVVETAELLAIPGGLMWDLMNKDAALAVRVLRLVAKRLHEAHDRIRELSTERVQQRIARCLMRLVQKVGIKEGSQTIRLDIRLSRQDIAQMTGTTLETVSRVVTAWERANIIDAGREYIAILDPHALVKIAEDLP